MGRQSLAVKTLRDLEINVKSVLLLWRSGRPFIFIRASVTNVTYTKSIIFLASLSFHRLCQIPLHLDHHRLYIMHL